MSRRSRRAAIVTAVTTPFPAAFLTLLNLPDGTPAWWMQAAALSPYAVALGMLAVMEACGLSDLDRPRRQPEPALVGEILPAHPVRVGAR